MRLWVLAVAALLAACSNGIVLEVYPADDVPTGKVRLFLGYRECYECRGIEPPVRNGGSLVEDIVLPGKVYYQEAENPKMVVREANVKDGFARFQIEASDAGEFLVAVAVDENGQSAALIDRLPTDEAGIYRVNLIRSQAEVLGPKPPNTTATFVAIWQRSITGKPCMGFERWEGGELAAERVFIVPEGDLDCDEVQNECNPYSFDGLGIPTIDKASCTTHGPMPADSEPCKIGGMVCGDITSGSPCAPSDYCAPELYCGDIGSLTPCNFAAAGGDLQKCLFQTQPSTILKCQVPVKTATNSPRRQVPCTTNFEFDVFGNTAPNTPIRCIGPDDELMLQAPMMGPLDFDHYADVPSTDGMTMANVRASLRFKYDQCKYKLEMEGQFADQLIDKNTFVQIWTQRAGAPVRKLLIPFRLEPFTDETCMAPPKCTLSLAAGETLQNCVTR